jgi:hypothetical protein
MEDNIQLYVREIGLKSVDGLVWLRIGTGDGLL